MMNEDWTRLDNGQKEYGYEWLEEVT